MGDPAKVLSVVDKAKKGSGGEDEKRRQKETPILYICVDTCLVSEIMLLKLWRKLMVSPEPNYFAVCDAAKAAGTND